MPPSMPLFHLQERAPWPPPPTDVVGKTVPPVAGAAAGTAVDAAPADDVGAYATAFEDAAGKTLVSGSASVAGAERGFLLCSPSSPDV